MGTSGIVERMEVHPESLYYHEHLARYSFAMSSLSPGWTLDIASGTGYGAEVLSHSLRSHVVGVDLDLSSLRASRRKYTGNHISFLQADAVSLPFADATFSNIVTLETIEHIADDEGYVREIARVLRRDGTCILSTPDRAYSLRHGIHNPYHVREYAEAELLRLLQSYFGSVEIYFQGFSTTYFERVQQYATTLQTQKRQLNPLLRLAIDQVYRPLKKHVPFGVTNYFIRRLLHRSYPQPEQSEIAITSQPGEDTSVFILILRQPCQVQSRP